MALEGKMFATQYTMGEGYLEGWSAKPIGAGQYIVVRPNGSERNVAIGEEIETKAGKQTVSLEDNGRLLKIGDNRITTGNDIQHGWVAIKSRGTSYKFRSPDNKYFGPFKTGETINAPGMIPGILQVDVGVSINGKTIPVEKKDQEIQILIMDEKSKKGFKSYFNVKQSGSDKKQSGTEGVFYKSYGKKPASFCEYAGDDDYAYRTAIFWDTKNPKYANVQVRSLQDAMREREIKTNLDTMVSEMKSLQGTPEQSILMEEVKGLEQQLEIANKQWKNITFNVQSGKDLIKRTDFSYSR